MELNEVKKRFKRCILEYTNAAGSFDLSEDGEDDAAMGGAAPTDGGGNTPMDGASMNGNGDMDGGMPMGGGDPAAMGGGAPAQAPNGFAPQGIDPNAGMDGMGGAAAPTDGGMPMNGGDPNAMGVTTEEPGDEVIDVDELVKSQEEAEHKIDSMTSKFDKLMGAIDVLIQQNKDRAIYHDSKRVCK